MFQQTVKTVKVKNPRISLATRTRQWIEAAEVVKCAAVCGYPLRDIQSAVDDCIAKGVACEATAYERREAISNAVYDTGYHVDRTDKVCRLSDLVGLRDVSLGTEGGRPCIRFKVFAKLGYGTEYLSAETFEWLSESGTPVVEDTRLDVYVEPLVEAAYALDAYMTDVTTEVYRRLRNVVPELRLRRRVSERYHNIQYAPIWAAGGEICAALAREGIVPDFGGEHLGMPETPDVLVTHLTYDNDDGEIDGTVFVVLIRSLGRAGVVSERNCIHGKPVWVTAANVNEALIEYERLRG